MLVSITNKKLFNVWHIITISLSYNLLGDEVIFLDPHTTQRSGSVDQKSDDNEAEVDATYHCKIATRIPITGMDPSVALVSKTYINYINKVSDDELFR